MTETLLAEEEKIPSADIIQQAYSMFSDVDPETGLDFEWLTIRNKLVSGADIGEVLPLMFDYYESKNNKMSPWCNYLLSCSHFTKEELDGKQNRNGRKKLENMVKQLMKKRQKNPSENINQFLYNNKNISI